MKITPVKYISTNLNNIHTIENNKEPQNTLANPTTPQLKTNFAYIDYNISFSGRTPEDFYAQDFNRENMPSTMKKFLYYDYEQRQHIPPEQMMQEVFKYLKDANNFSDVKSLYPNEELFQNLHQNRQKNKTSVLAEIKMAKEMSDAPLFKDGSDDLGMYLLKKIYLEGKTIKEISKDFLEKDINDEYKGIITKPINYDTTSAYGIKYPKNEFWQSFIATREEYKKFFITLPKNMVDPNREQFENFKNKNNKQNNIENNTQKPQKPAHRKYRIQKFKKDQLSNDIKNSKGTPDVISAKIRKRFAKDDPEASFITKYMSPIMTVAADRVHLSEEMRYFNEIEKENGKISNEEHMFERFWKANPQILEEYAKIIPDTIELFEETYGAGGLIPINKDLEMVTSKTENQDIIDNVTPEFYNLLQFSQNIETERQKRNIEHDELQKLWDQHFIERYGEPDKVTVAENEIDEDLEEELKGVKALNPEFSTELLKETAEKYNADIYKLHGKDGEDIIITGNLDEIFRTNLENEIKLFPTSYGALYKRYMSTNPEINEKLKLSLATKKVAHMIDDDRIMTSDELENALIELNYKFMLRHYNETLSAKAAIADTIALNLKNKTPLNIYDLNVDDYNHLPEDHEVTHVLHHLIQKNKNDINKLYAQYNTPLSKSELNKIGLAMLDELSKYTGNKSSLNSDDTETIIMLKEMTNNFKFEKKFLRNALEVLLPEYRYSRSLLNKELTPEIRQKKFEQLMGSLLNDMLSRDASQTPILTNILTKEIINRHQMNLTAGRYELYMKMAKVMDPLQQRTFNYTFEQLKALDEVYQKKK